MTRAELACRLACAHLAKVTPRRYLWTFTFPRTEPDWCCGRTFSVLWEWWHRKLGCPGCIKVVELHKEHGVHFHVIVDRRFPVEAIRRYAEYCGFGRVHVVALKSDNDGAYIAKYLTKDRGKLFGVNRYGVLGDWRFGRVRDVEIDSKGSRRCRMVWAWRKANGEQPTREDMVAALYRGDDWLKWLPAHGRRPRGTGKAVYESQGSLEDWRQFNLWADGQNGKPPETPGASVNQMILAAPSGATPGKGGTDTGQTLVESLTSVNT